MSLIADAAAAKAYQDGFEDGKAGKTPRLIYLMGSNTRGGQAYKEGFDRGERSAANQSRVFLE